MQVKLKICSGCNQPKPIWKREGKDLYCQFCWSKIKPQTPLKQSALPKSQKPIPKQSDRRKKLDAAYSILRNEYMKNHPKCMAMLVGCTLNSEHCHHLFWGKDREQHMNDFSNVMAICASCHRSVHDKLSAEEAIEMGFKKQRN